MGLGWVGLGWGEGRGGEGGRAARKVPYLVLNYCDTQLHTH